MSLTNKQRAFIIEYVKDYNGTQAVIRAGYDVKDENSAAVIANENLRKPKILDAIDEYFAPHVMSAKEVLYHLTAIARGDIGDILDESGTPDVELAKANRKTPLIKRIKTKTITTKNDNIIDSVEFELYDRLSALRELAKFHQLTNTNTTRIEDWKSDAIKMIQENKIDFEETQAALLQMGKSESLAFELFQLAGVPVESEA